MARNRRFTVKLKRRREGKTNYKSRIKILSSKKTRLVVRKRINGIIAQLVNYSVKGDQVLVSVSTLNLKKIGWNYHINNLPSSYLLGYLLGFKAIEKGLKEAILDVGLVSSIKGGSVYAVLKGAIDAGLSITASEKIFPTERRIKGNHIREYALKLQGKGMYEKQFSRYLKNNVKPENIVQEFDKIKGSMKK